MTEGRFHARTRARKLAELLDFLEAEGPVTDTALDERFGSSKRDWPDLMLQLDREGRATTVTSRDGRYCTLHVAGDSGRRRLPIGEAVSITLRFLRKRTAAKPDEPIYRWDVASRCDMAHSSADDALQALAAADLIVPDGVGWRLVGE